MKTGGGNDGGIVQAEDYESKEMVDQNAKTKEQDERGRWPRTMSQVRLTRSIYARPRARVSQSHFGAGILYHVKKN